MKILFVDMVAPAPYTTNTLKSYALGGTEATVLRVARGLAKEGVDVALFQGVNSDRAETVISGIRHVGENASFSPDVIIHVRTAFFIEGFRAEYPAARHIVWLHDIVNREMREELRDEEVVCVSHWHLSQMIGAIDIPSVLTLKSANVIYNIVEDVPAVLPEKVPGRLGFFSSPHKGFSQVFAAFGRAQSENPALSLVISNPGYVPDARVLSLPVINLGQLPHDKVMKEMAKCEVLFYPQTVFPETMGLVMAEAEAVGTPVLAHDFGAAKEVCGPLSRVVDCTKPENIEAALVELLEQNQQPVADERFKSENVIKAWKALLGVEHEAHSVDQGQTSKS